MLAVVASAAEPGTAGRRHQVRWSQARRSRAQRAAAIKSGAHVGGQRAADVVGSHQLAARQ